MKFCSLYSGSSGNSMYVEGTHGRILVDAGLSGIKITTAMRTIGADPTQLCGILVTHDHSDHIKGVGILSRKFNIPLYMNEATWLVAKDQIGLVRDEHLRIVETNQPFFIEDLWIHPFSLHHDAADPMGFSISSEKKKISIVTDTGMLDESMYGCIRSSDLVVMESNHDVNMLMAGPYPYFLKKRVAGDRGHLSNETAAQVIIRLVEEGLTKVVLAHLSQENNFPQLALETTRSRLKEKGMDEIVSVEVAARYEPGIPKEF
jgi:phosphoribosyl 1,2-cyclic phosphodiesterase